MNNEAIKHIGLRTITAFVLMGTFLFTFFLFPPLVLSVILTAACIYILIAEWPLLCKSSYFLSLLTPLYPILPFILLILLNHDLSHRFILFMMFTLVCAFDTGAYISGSSFGAIKIAPRISPKKTVEGVVGGYIFCLIACIIITLFYHHKYDFSAFHFIGIIIIPFITSIFAFLGDLFESWLKRRVHIKDSGTLLPGHGGLLDRFDSILFVTPVFYLLKEFIDMLLLAKF